MKTKASILGLAFVLAACSGATASSPVPTTAVAPVTTLSTAQVPATATPTTPPTTAAPVAEPTTTAPLGITISNVVDGDTVDLSTGERIRIIGIDTPETGQCGFEDAADALTAMTFHMPVVVTAGARDDKDRYGRYLRYIDVGDADVGLALIQQGLAIARYDSRDGYGHHPREESYIAAESATPSTCAALVTTEASAPASTTATPPGSDTGSAYYANCTAARAAGAAPLHEGEPGYRSGLDRDHDGVACE